MPSATRRAAPCQANVRSRRRIFQVVIFGFDSLHAVVDGFAYIGTLWEVEQF
jgi:hypothetical protein